MNPVAREIAHARTCGTCRAQWYLAGAGVLVWLAHSALLSEKRRPVLDDEGKELVRR